MSTSCILHLGLSPLSGSPAPPTSLSFPEIDEATLDTTPLWWLSVVETATNCPPVRPTFVPRKFAGMGRYLILVLVYSPQGLHIPPQYGLTSVQLTTTNVEESD